MTKQRLSDLNTGISNIIAMMIFMVIILSVGGTLGFIEMLSMMTGYFWCGIIGAINMFQYIYPMEEDK